MTDKTVSVPQLQEYRFDRYREGRLMAEGARVRACSEVEAEQKAKALFHPWDARDTLRLRAERKLDNAD